MTLMTAGEIQPIKSDNMRQLLVFVFFLFISATSQAQYVRDIIPVDWKEMQKVADNDPQRIKDLVSRLSTNEIDTTMTWNERILAYYGQSYLTPMTELAEGRTLDKLFNEKKYEECLTEAKELLKKNPVSLKALSKAAFSISRMVKDTTNTVNVTIEEGQVYYNRMMRIFNTIATTGDGTKENPFYVTAVSDEYLFLHYYLDIWEVELQSLVGQCDLLELKEESEYYDRPQIYFEITRVLEIESDMLR